MTEAKAYEFMVKFTPQKEWIEQRGLLMCFSTFFVEVGAACFVVSSMLNYPTGMFIGLVLCGAVGGGLHLADLGRPTRFWMILFSPGWKTSWISRGIWFITMFIGFGGMYLALAFFNIWSNLILIVSNALAVCTIVYFGFVLNNVKALALWNNGLMPILIFFLSIWGGLDVVRISKMLSGVDTANQNMVSVFLLIVIAFITGLLLFTTSTYTKGGRVSARDILAGKSAAIFWIGFVCLGIFIPVGCIIGYMYGVVSAFFLLSSIVSELIGNISLRYCLFKSAVYEPIVS